jgi:hypothetical protein
VTRNKKKGTATLQVEIPNPGTLALSGKGVKPRGAAAAVSVPAGTAKLVVKARGKKKTKKLEQTGKVG